MPWPKSAPTPSQMKTQGQGSVSTDFETLKQELLDLLQQVRGASELHPHIFFGELSQKDWGCLIYKHLDHHLKQFRG